MRCAMQMAVGAVLLATGWAAAQEPAPGGAAERERVEFFERRVRPLLVEKCQPCHGPQKQESGLRLDSRAALLAGGDGGPVVAPGDPQRSRLLQVVRREDDLQMPPDDPLEPAHIAALTRWIEAGAAWPADEDHSGAGPDEDQRLRSSQHWAFQPLVKPPLPEVPRADGAQNPVDLFVLARQRAAGVAAAPRADAHTLIRRASFDLLGLPPTPEQVDAFVHDAQRHPAAAFDRLVDRLLASPRYGERWGRHWLDVARYADNKGYVFFEDKKYPWAYTYRDYVIAALNADLPYDRFVLEQLAADQLAASPPQASLAAMGFLTLGGHFMNNTHDIIDDRIDVVTRGLLGLTVTCARCHDHKYDAIPQRDYYSLYGVFRSGYEPTLPPLLSPPPDDEQYRKFVAEMDQRLGALVDFVTARHRELVNDARTRIADYLLAAHRRRGKPPADNFMLLVDKGELNPTMILRWQRYLEDPQRHAEVWSIWRELSALPAEDFSGQSAAAIGRLVSEEGAGRLNLLVRQAFAGAPPASIDEAAQRYARLLHDADAAWRAVLAEHEQAGQPPPQALGDEAQEQLRRVLYGRHAPPDAPLAMDWGFLSLFPDRPTQNEYKKLLKAVEEWSAEGEGAPPRAMVLLDAETPYDPHIFLRGNPNRWGAEVPRQFLSLLRGDGPPFVHGSGRLELARAIVDPANPLTARVLVNRVWMHHFGTPLVATPSDFGLRSEPPTHPQLLDWLAATFVEQGWSIKRLHRLIMTSGVYQMQSTTRGAAAAGAAGGRDESRLLSKMNRRRLEFEALRDALLAVSGKLDSAMAGPPVAAFDGGPSDRRRSVYGFIDRMDVSPLLTTFDFPNPIASSPQRTSTTVAPQALYFLNNNFVADAARQLTQRPDVARLADPRLRAARVYRLVFARPPNDDELELAVRFVAAGGGGEDRWQQLAHALLMTNEFAFVD